MPFTFAHPAIVLPLAKYQKWFSLTGLTIGSMSPDFEYFLRMEITSHYSHRVIGVFLFDLPVSLLVTLIFHHIIRNPMIENLPTCLYQRFNVYRILNWTQYAVNHGFILIVSILIGIISHLIWDAFTHQSGIFVMRFPYLQQTVMWDSPIYKLLQHGSTLLGMIFIGLFIFYQPKISTEKPSVSLRYWVSVLGITLLIFTIRALLSSSFNIGHMVVTGIMACFISLVLVSWITQRQHRACYSDWRAKR